MTYGKQLQQVLGIRLLIPAGSNNAKAYDVWADADVDKKVQLLMKNGDHYPPWGGIEHLVYFAIKTVPTRSSDAPLSFQVCCYAKDQAVRDWVFGTLIPEIEKTLGCNCDDKKGRYTFWTSNHFTIQKIINEVIPAIKAVSK